MASFNNTRAASAAESAPHPYCTLHLQFELDRASLAPYAVAEGEDHALQRDLIDIALVPIDSAPGTGVTLLDVGGRSPQVMPAHGHVASDVYPDHILSQATASLLPLQDLLQPLLVPFGIVFEAPAAKQGHVCAVDGHLPQLKVQSSFKGKAKSSLPCCAMQLPQGLTATVIRGAEPERALLPEELAGSCWDMANSRYHTCRIVIHGVGIAKSSKVAEHQEGSSGRQQEKVTPQIQPIQSSVEPVTASMQALQLDNQATGPTSSNQQVAQAQISSSTSSSVFIPSQNSTVSCASANRRNFKLELSETSEPSDVMTGPTGLDCLEGVHVIERWLGSEVFEQMVRGIFPNGRMTAGAELSQCQPLYWDQHDVHSMAYDDSKYNGLLMDVSTRREFVNLEVFTIINGVVHVMGIATDWPRSAAYVPRCPSGVYHGLNSANAATAKQELDSLMKATVFEPNRPGIALSKYAATHLKAAWVLYRHFGAKQGTAASFQDMLLRHAQAVLAQHNVPHINVNLPTPTLTQRERQDEMREFYTRLGVVNLARQYA